MDGVAQAFPTAQGAASAGGDEGISNVSSAMDIDDFPSVHDIRLQYDDKLIPCDSRVLKANSTVFRGLIDNGSVVPREDGELPILAIEPYEHCEAPVFQSLIESLHDGTCYISTPFETQSSFYTCVKLCLIAMNWGMDGVRDVALDIMKDGAQSITQKKDPNRGLGRTDCLIRDPLITVEKPDDQVTTAERAAQNADMDSFVRGVQLAHKHGWHPKLWSELWDCGEAMVSKLLQSPTFWTWARGSREGQYWAGALGVQVNTNTWLMDEA
ncbi:hypothetical protein SLS62_010814 [Diatrype stigma]|uniref:BTB domain-containing protein n=1 Tax=Diatrype stigma TaxID=117547 RepID=A0AAN9YFH3_9PEZI